MIAPSNVSTQSQTFSGPPVAPVPDNIPRIESGDTSSMRLRWSTMRLEYMSKYYQTHREISRYINPKRGFFEGYVPNWNGQIDHRLLISGKPRRCVRTLAAGMQSGLSTPSRPWFLLGLPDQDLEQFGPVKYWLETARNIVLRVFGRSNWYHAAHHQYEELGMFGTGNFGIFEDFRNVIAARSFTCGEYYVAVDEAGKPCAVARQFYKTVDNVVNEYGWANCTQKTQLAYKQGQRDTYVLLYELCERNTTLVDGRVGFEGKKWRQITVEADAPQDKMLARGGYNEFPYVVTRWDTVTTADTMGVGPGTFAVGDTKSTYRLKKDLLLGVQKKVDPPVIINGSVQGQANMNPGGITRSSSQVQNPGAQAAYQVDIDLKDGQAFLEMFYRELEEEFYTDLFSSMLSIGDEKKTAAEIAARHEEKLLLIGPVLERVFGEMFDPSIERTIAICWRAGLLPPPPPEIEGMKLMPRYVSLLAQAQQLVASAASDQGLAYLANVKAVYPEALDVVNADELVRDKMQSIGITAKAINPPETVAELREKRAQQQAEIEAKQDAMAATVAAKNLAETPVGDRSALEHIAGVEPAPGGTA